jgi:hypothetical protein
MLWYNQSMQTNKRDRGDLSGILDISHENKRVAIASDYSRVIAAADSLRDLLRSVADTSAIFCKVLPHDVSFAPSATVNIPRQSRGL